MKKYLLSIFLLSIIILNNHSSFGSEQKQDEIINPASHYPLGGVWRDKFPEIYQTCHIEMARAEMESSSRADKAALEGTSSDSFGQVHALFRSRVYFQDPDKTFQEYLDLIDINDHIFISGGNVIQKMEPLTFCSIVKERLLLNEEMKNKKRSISTTLESMTKLSKHIENPEEIIKKIDELKSLIEHTAHEYEDLKRRAENIRDFEQRHESECACKEEGYKKHVYDSEQIIIRLLDFSLNRLNFDDVNLHVLGRSIPLEWIKNIILHLHSRFDMCPYCLNSLHIKMKQWNVFLKERILKQPSQFFLSFVSSRQEYLPSTMYLYTLSNSVYRGSSMRSLGIDQYSNQVLREEEFPSFAEHSIVIQIPISFYEIYI